MKRLFKSLTWIAAAGLAVYGGYVARAFARYGRPDTAGAPDPLLDRFMPEYEVRDFHEIRVQAPAAITMRVAREMPLDRGMLSRAIFALRALPARLQGRSLSSATASRGLEADARAIGWGVLADVPDRHLVMGCATKPWKADVIFEAIPAEAFAAFNRPDYAKIVWTLRAEEDGLDASIFRLETRVLTTDPLARRKFRRYWALLSPGIKAIRYEGLGLIKQTAERAASTSHAA